MQRWVFICSLLGACNGPGAAWVAGDPTAQGWVGTLPPLVSAGADRQVLPGAPLCLDGRGTYHPQGMTLYYSWQQTLGAPVSLSDIAQRSPCFVAPLSEQTLAFRLSASDGVWLTTDTVTVQVSSLSPPAAPVVRAGPDRMQTHSAAAGPLAEDVAYADLNAAIIWETVVPQAAPGSAGILANVSLFRLRGALNGVRSLPDYVLVWPYDRSLNSRRAPKSALSGPSSAITGDAISLDAKASVDGFGEALRWRWQQTCGDDLALDSDNQSQLSITLPRRPQTMCLRVSVRDSFLESAPRDLVIITRSADGSPMPIAQPAPALESHAGNLMELNADPSGALPEGTRLSWVQSVGPQVAWTQEGTRLRFIAPATPSALAFTVLGSTAYVDGNLAVSIVRVVPPSRNTPPQVVLCADSSAPPAGSTVFLLAAASDAEQDAFSQATAWGDAPQGTLSIVPQTGAFIWPAACGPQPTLHGVPATLFGSRFIAPAAGTEATIDVTVCDILNSCGAATISVTSQ